MQCCYCHKETKNPKFCSKTCSVSFNNLISPKRKLTESCLKCATKIPKKNKYCAKCQNRQKEAWDNLSLFDIKSIYKGQAHSRIRYWSRKNYLETTNEVCCTKCGYNKHIEVCHIKAIKDFSDETNICTVNAIENLIGLCPNCHWELDHGL